MTMRLKLCRTVLSRTGLGMTMALSAAFSAALSTARAQESAQDGVKIATTFPGEDIGARVNAAFAACSGHPCTVFVPAGDYSFHTTIVVPAGESYTLRMDSGAFLHYEGDGWALSTSMRAGRSFIRGGHIFGNPKAKAGIILLPVTQGIYIDEIDVRHFSEGDGILNVGANVVKITNVQVRDNLYGVHIMAAPGYAGNAVTISGSNIVGSKRWGIIDGDRALFPANFMGLGLGAGSASPQLGNSFVNNNLELNGRDPSGKYGAVLEALTYKSLYSGNYFEASPHNIQIGCMPAPDPVYQRLYGVSGPNCGTSVSTTVRDNYFTAGAPIEVELFAAIDAIIDGNAEMGPNTNCFASVTGSATNAMVSSNHLDGSPKSNHGKGEWFYCHGSGASLAPGFPK